MRRPSTVFACLFALLVTCVGCSSDADSSSSDDWIRNDAHTSSPDDVSTDVMTDTAAGSPAHCCIQAADDIPDDQCDTASRTESHPSCEGNTGCTSLDNEMQGCGSVCLACYNETCVASLTAACDL